MSGLILCAVSQDGVLEAKGFSQGIHQRRCDHVNGQFCFLYGTQEDANTHIPPPPLAKRPRRGRAVKTVQSSFVVTYTGFTPEARAAFQYAVDIWASFIRSPVLIRIDAEFKYLGGYYNGFIILGGTRNLNQFSPTSEDLWYPVALANKISKRDLDISGFDMKATFNSATEAGWYFGTDGNISSGQYDFVSLVLHEIGHGLAIMGGAADTFDVNNPIMPTEGELRHGTPRYPYIYDNFVVNGSGTAITSFEDPSADLFTQFTSDNLFWDGTQGKAANDGSRPKLYAPSPWNPGPSYYHLDEDTYPPGSGNSLMTPFMRQAEVTHHPGPIVLGMLEDMGWTINSPPVFATDTTTRSVEENTAAGTNIGSAVTATDSDTGDTLTYSLRGTDATSFAIESTTGQLKTSVPLNYEVKDTYTLTVVVDDSVTEDTIEVTINVTDTNDPPRFSTASTTREILEGTSANQNIGAPVLATDEDLNDTALTYSLGGTDAGSFSIDEGTGQLKTKSVLNYNTRRTYEISVIATGSENLTGSISVTINVIGIVSFTDTALAAAVRRALGIASEASILTNALASLMSLTASGDDISDLMGLEYATGLTSLNLSDNAIVDLSALENLVSLETLDLSDNAIVNLSNLSGLSALTDLDLLNNKITNISSLRGLTSLETLDLDGNKIENVSSLSGLSSLRRLELRNNNIMDVTPLSGMTHLTHLYLRGNENLTNIKRLLKLTSTTIDITLPDFVEIPDTNLAAALRSELNLPVGDPILPEEIGTLTTFSASNRGIITLTGLETAAGLSNLTLSNNTIEDLEPLEELTGLTDLNLSNNQIVDLEPLEDLTSLETLDLRNNLITDVAPLAGLGKLTLLQLGGNSVANPGALYELQRGGTTITGVDVPTDVIFVDANLEAVVRQALRIAAADPISPDVMATLTQLTAAGKSITSLSGLEDAGLLETLDVGQNAISDLGPLSGLTRLERLDLADNPITNISSLSGLTRLERLDLRNNNVTDTALLSRMTHLRYLYVRGNENLESLKQLVKLKEAGTIVDITLPRPVTFRDDNLKVFLRSALGLQPDDPIFPEDMEVLTTFSAPNAGIVTLTGLETATALTSLVLSDNQITSLSPLSRLAHLTNLNLSTNQISSVSSLSGLTSLTDLNLSGNRISSVSSLSRLTNLTTLNLSMNQIITLTSLSGLSSLRTLNLSDNRIRNVLPLQVLSRLRTLNLSGNVGITNADVLYKLEQGGTTVVLPPGITLPTNAVVFNNTALEASVRSALRISTGSPIYPEKITDLIRLTATRKEIDDLTGLEAAMRLEILDLGDNAISDLEPLENLTGLTTLDLADNAIETLRALSGLSNLTILDLDDNQIEDVSPLRNLSSLTRLELRDNDVMDVTPLKDLTNLNQIYLRGNENLEHLEWLGALENLRSDINLPDVVRIPDANLDVAVRTALRSAGNTVSNDLPMSEELLESLEALTASNRNIVNLTGCEYMTSLTSLDLRNNQIRDVLPLSRLYSLETLMLAGNPILDTSVLRELERRGTEIDITIYRYPFWDVNQDSDVDEADLYLITATITGESPDVNGDGLVNGEDREAADANRDGLVDTDDLLFVFEKQDRPVRLAPPLLSVQDTDLNWQLLERIDAGQLRVQLAILSAKSDGSLKYQQTIAFLQAILITIQPNQTLLLVNYPNPFNPETWIPYQLARGSNVRIAIYDTKGAVVRRLALGYRSEGYYRIPSRAAYWDGRNNVGERVASGIYFYQLETDDVSLLRKMVILK